MIDIKNYSILNNISSFRSYQNFMSYSNNDRVLKVYLYVFISYKFFLYLFSHFIFK
jgi:hypothetical protein